MTESATDPTASPVALPPEWAGWLESEVADQSDPALRAAALGTFRACLLWVELQHRQSQFHEQARRAADDSSAAQQRHREALTQAKASAEAADRHATAMRNATWVLAGATIALVLATIGLIWATFSA